MNNIKSCLSGFRMQGRFPAGGIVLLACLCFCGCFSSSPEVRYYDFRPVPSGPVFEGDSGATLGAVQLVDVHVPEPLNDRRLFYRSSSIEAGHYEYHRWIREPSKALAHAMVRSLEDSDCFSLVAGPDEPALRHAVRLRLFVEDLNEVDLPPKPGQSDSEPAWAARVAFRIQITKPGNDAGPSLFVKEEEPVLERNAKGVAIAINNALGRVLARSVAGIVERSVPPITD